MPEPWQHGNTLPTRKYCTRKVVPWVGNPSRRLHFHCSNSESVSPIFGGGPTTNKHRMNFSSRRLRFSHCGPHDWHTCETKCSLNVSRPINIDYKDRVYNYFFELFPEMVEEFPAYAASEQMHKWTTFWHEYIEWVES